MFELHTRVKLKEFGVIGVIFERHQNNFPEPLYRVKLDEVLFTGGLATETLSCLESELEPANPG